MTRALLAAAGLLWVCGVAGGCYRKGATPPAGTTYYVDRAEGLMAYDGLSPEKPWKSLDQVNATTFEPGDSILLKSGQVFEGTLKPRGSGEAGAPITVGKYGGDERPVIDGQGKRACVHLTSVSGWEIEDLELVNDGGENPDADAEFMRAGVYAVAAPGATLDHIALRNLKIHAIYPSGTRRARLGGVFHEAYGVHFFSWWDDAAGPGSFAGITIEGCEISDVSGDGIWFSRRAWDEMEPAHNFVGVTIRHNRLEGIGGAGIVPMRCRNLLVEDNIITHTGARDDPRQLGMGSGIYAWRSKDVLIQRNQFLHARGWVDSAGAQIGLGNSDLVYQHNLSRDNAGGFIEVFGGSHNAVFRHNISVNDGRRVRDTDNGMNDTPNDSGKIVWISSYNGEDQPPAAAHDIGIHNNTIYVGPETEPQIVIDRMAHGIALANNILYVDGTVSCRIVGESSFDRNLYWGTGKDIAGLSFGPGAIFAEPFLANAGGPEPDDYRIGANSPAIDAGAALPNPGTRDFWGDELSSHPPLDIGADERVPR